MLHHRLSRRSVLAMAGLGAVSLSAVSLGASCDGPPPPKTSPFFNGRFPTRSTILGETAGTQALRQPFTARELPPDQPYHYNVICKDGRTVDVPLPATVPAAIYYPYRQSATGLGLADGPFPVLLFAHGLRFQETACQARYPMNRDFTKLDEVMSHVASYGFVAVVPDISWLPGDIDDATLEPAFDFRARILLAYFQHLHNLNQTTFAGQLDFNRVIMAGHSTGCGAAAIAGRRLSSVISLDVLAYAMLAPYFRSKPASPHVGADTRNLLVVHGGADGQLTPDALSAFNLGGGPKTHVTIPGANHFGYTELCEGDNTCDLAAPGTIPRYGQQRAASSYLVALLRHRFQGDEAMAGYLSGQKPVEGLESVGVSGVQVQSAGYPTQPIIRPSELAQT